MTAVGGGTEIQGTLTSIPNHTFTLEFFANAARDATTLSDTFTPNPGEFSQGQTYIGSYQVTIGATGTANFTANLAALPAKEPFVTATATDITNTGSGPANNTSEFSPVVPLGGPSFVVTNTGDTGLGTLREAIYSADNTAGSHTITFDIPSTDPRHFYYTNAAPAGQVSQSDIATTTAASDSAIANIDAAWPHSWYSIEPTSPLPPLYDIDSIDGYSQPGSAANTLVPDQQGLNTVLTIEIDGQNVTGDGLTLEAPPSNTSGAAGTSVIQGLAINRFSGNGITTNSFAGDAIAGNFIGTDVSGTLALGNGASGVYVNDVNDFTIGGSANGAANLISGNGADGINVYDDGIAGLVDGDVIGGGRSGTSALPNAEDGADIGTGTEATTAAMQPETDAGPAVAIEPSAAAKYTPIQIKATHFIYELFGIDVNGAGAASVGAACLVGVITSTLNPGEFQPKSLTVSLAAAPGLAIRLEGGANAQTNIPVLAGATTAASTTVTGTLSSQPSSTYLIQFYSNTQVLPSGYGPGQHYIGSVNVATSAAGKGSFTFQSPTPLSVGQYITATATLLDSSGNPVETSEFSQGILVQKLQLQVAKVTTTNLFKGRTNKGVSTISIIFNEAMAPLADSSNFYSLVTPKKVRVHKKVMTEMVPVKFTARFTASDTVALKLVKPSKSPLTLTVKSGDPASTGRTLENAVTFNLP